MLNFVFLGYGFVDFEVPMAAESAVKALQAQGIQAQMAKVSTYMYTYCSIFIIHLHICGLMLPVHPGKDEAWSKCTRKFL